MIYRSWQERTAPWRVGNLAGGFASRFAALAWLNEQHPTATWEIRDDFTEVEADAVLSGVP